MRYFRQLLVLSLTILILLSNACKKQSPKIIWARIHMKKYDDKGMSVQETSDGGYIIAGLAEWFGNKRTAYLIKTDSLGEILWTKSYGGKSYSVAFSVQQTLDGGYIIVGSRCSFGRDNEDIYLIKTDSLGDTLWTKTYGGTEDDVGSSVQQTSDGGFIIVGWTNSFGAGLHDVYIIKTNAIGDTIWTKIIGGEKGDNALSVKVTSDGGYIVVGQTCSYRAGDPDVYLIKTDSEGDTLWSRKYGGLRSDWGTSVLETPDNGYIVIGYTLSFGASDLDVYLIKTDEDGDTIWTKTYGGKEYDGGLSVQMTSDGGYIIVGETESFGAGGKDIYLLKTDGNGNTLWTKTYGGTGDDVGTSVQVSSDDAYVITGWTTQQDYFYDIFIMKIK